MLVVASRQESLGMPKRVYIYKGFFLKRGRPGLESWLAVKSTHCSSDIPGCLRVSVAGMKDCEQKQFGEERVYFTPVPI